MALIWSTRVNRNIYKLRLWYYSFILTFFTNNSHLILQKNNLSVVYFLFILWTLNQLGPLPDPLGHNLYKFKSTIYQRAHVKVWLLQTIWFWRKRFLYFLIVSSLFFNYLPFEGELTLHLKKKTRKPTPKNALCKICLKMAKWFRRRRLLKHRTQLSFFPNYLSFKEYLALHLNKVE